MIRRALVAVFLTGVVVLSGAGAVNANAPATRFTANLTGAEETPPVATAATGRFHMTLTDNGTKLRYRLSANGIDRITQAHIHIGAKGVAGPVVVFFFAPVPASFHGGTVTGEGFLVGGVRTASDVDGGPTHTWAELIAALRSGGAYVNVHSFTHPGGEIRGQIQPVMEGDEED